MPARTRILRVSSSDAVSSKKKSERAVADTDTRMTVSTEQQVAERDHGGDQARVALVAVDAPITRSPAV
jgi:hypothetical protein